VSNDFESTKANPVEPMAKMENMSTPKPNFPPVINNLMAERLSLEKQFIAQSQNAILMQPAD